LKRLGYRRIGICLSEQVDSFSHHACRSTAYYFHSTTRKPEQVPPLFYGGTPTMEKKQLQAWVRQTRPEVVVGLTNQLVKWINEIGISVPREISVVHLAIDDDVRDWAGINADKREIGAAAAEWVITLLQSHRFGLPKKAMNMLVRGSWCSGCTLAASRSKALNLK